MQKPEPNSSFFILNSALTAEDTLNYARRLVAERCIYGVDKNPLAVEIAKLSLWLVTLAKDFPFTFVDHALKCGDSLVGASADDFERWAHVIRDSTMLLWKDEILGNLHTARQKRKELEGFVVRDVQDAARKTELLREAEAATERVRRGADLMTGARLLGLKAQELESLLDRLAMAYGAGELFDEIDPAQHYDAARALQAAQKERIFHWEFAFPEVFERGGFSAFVGNPPFIGGKRIREMLGDTIRQVLYDLYPGSDGGADIAAFFFLRAFNLLRRQGFLGLIATNTISQGDTRNTGLEKIYSNGGVIYRALVDAPWPGAAAVSVNIVYMSKSSFKQPYYLDDKEVAHISSFLASEEQEYELKPLLENSGKSFVGSFVNGMGFVLETEEAERLLRSAERNKDVIFPYLNGEDINSDPNQVPSRWVINFFDWPLEKAELYSEPMKIVRDRVYPVRAQVNRDAHRKYWWHYGDKRPALYRTISGLKRVLVAVQTSKYLSICFQPAGIVYSHMTVVFSLDKGRDFAVLNSTFHELWVRKYASTLETRLRYLPSDCFETFPFPRNLSGLEEIGERYHETRRQIMLARQEGLTKTYNRFHNPEEQSADIRELRRLHVEMDSAVAAAYGWEELELGHDFHETAQGTRYTISESARRDVLSRLLKLNHERWDEEQKSGALDGGKKKAGKAGAKREAGSPSAHRKLAESPAQYGLLMDIAPVPEPETASEKPTPIEEIGSWDQCVCLGCGKHLVGFSVAEHTKSVHQGMDPGYRKVKK